MRRTLAVAVASFVAVASARGQAPPSTDIYLAPLSMRGGRPVVGTPINVTSRPGYDNQPSFTPDSRAILFTSVRDDGQSDIYRYDIATKATTRVTSTPESEYSATVMPGGNRFSVIRVEKDSTQRLWSFAMDGTDPQLVLKALRPVGYHAWLDGSNLALFVLGKPNALVHANVQTDKSDTLARNIGRSLQPLRDRTGFSRDRTGFSYVRTTDSGSMLAEMHWPNTRSFDLVLLPRGSQDMAWMSAELALTASGTTLKTWSAPAHGWENLIDLASAGLTDITRLAVSPDGRWLAIVAMPKP